jgi:hypothetical protein
MDEDDDPVWECSIENRMDSNLRASNYSVYSGLSGHFAVAYLDESVPDNALEFI